MIRVQLELFLITKIEEKLASEKLVDVWELNQFHGYQYVM